MLSTLTIIAMTMSPAQCINGQCSRPFLAAPALIQPSPAPTDRSAPWSIVTEEDPEKVHLFRGSTRVLGYDATADVVRWYQNGRWGDAARNPSQVVSKPSAAKSMLVESGPPRPESAEEATRPPAGNYGIDLDKLGHRERYSLNGREVSQAEAFQAAGDDLVDDSHLRRLTVIGTPEQRKAVVEDLKSSPKLSGYRDQLVIKTYSPADWAVNDAGFVTSGKPTIYLQAPNGKVLHRQDDYDGPDSLASAIRKSDPNYDPAKDPDLRKSSSNPLSDALSGFTPTTLGLVGIIVALIFKGPLLAAGGSLLARLRPQPTPSLTPDQLAELMRLLEKNRG
ncbi:hypothetical protein [Tuwongella immobilis]|uniref:Uncharacterized protein n=1 Tax=Tuwongella immobilis TaxID=692036 RepID=A0A6C2YPJ9_9BACT|nr:hypothetical protein [Tuwongella immobilis]VIP03053.1 unnamed protein product [Tuwongella immobilis]VTS03246.1 unnamed protein product [Tuwongella immobilis]